MRDLERLAREAGFRAGCINSSNGESLLYIAPSHATDCADQLQCFAALVLEEAAKVADEACGAMFCHGDKDGAEIAMGLRDAIRALKDKK